MTATPHRAMPWYFSPRVIVLGVLLPVYVALWFASEVAGLRISTTKGFDFFRGEAFLAGLAGLAALAYGTLLPVHVFRIDDRRRLGLVPPLWFVYAIGLLAMVGYLYWFRELIANPRALLDLLKAGDAISYNLRSNIERSAGIASLSTLGLAFFALLAHRQLVARAGSMSPRLLALAILLFLLTVFRAFAWAERLALFEVIIVLALFWIGHSDRASRGGWRLVSRFMPVLAIVGTISLFGVAEYFRSWASHYAEHEASFWGFILQRLVNYYYQALNTGAGMITMFEWPSYQFGNVLDWLHRFPFLLGPILRFLTQIRRNDFLERYGDPEFNNPSGLFGVLFDVGLAPALVLFAVTGLLAQSAYRAFQERDNVLGLLYPVFFLALIEFFRYWYLGNSRAFLFIVALVLAALLARPGDGRVAR